MLKYLPRNRARQIARSRAMRAEIELLITVQHRGEHSPEAQTAERAYRKARFEHAMAYGDTQGMAEQFEWATQSW